MPFSTRPSFADREDPVIFGRDSSSGKQGIACRTAAGAALDQDGTYWLHSPDISSGGQEPAATGAATDAASHESDFILRDVRTRRRRRGRKRRVLAVLGTALLVCGGLVAGTFVYLKERLEREPLELATIGTRLAAELSARAGRGYKVSIGRSFLAQEDGRPSITLNNFALLGENGETILSAPKAIVGLDWSALAIGQIRPRRLAIAGLDVLVNVAADGGLSVSAGRTRIHLTGASRAGSAVSSGAAAPLRSGQAAPAVAQTEAPSSGNPDRPRVGASASMSQQLAIALGELFRRLSEDDSPLSRLGHVGIAGGRLIFRDTSRGVSTTFGGLDFEIRRWRGRIEVNISAQGQVRRWRIEAAARVDAGHILEVSVSDIGIDEIALLGGWRELPIDFDMPMSARINMRVGLAGEILAATGSLQAGKGYLLVRHRDFEPTEVDRFSARLRWQAEQNRIAVEDMAIAAGRTLFSLAGHIAPPQDGRSGWQLSLASVSGGSLADQRDPARSVAFGKLEVAASFDPVASAFTLERLGLTAPDADVLFSARYEFVPGARRLQLIGQADAMASDRAMSLWGGYLAPEVRRWVTQNLSGGSLDYLRVKLDFDEEVLRKLPTREPLPDRAIEVAFKVSDATLRYLPDTAPISRFAAEGQTIGAVSTIRIKGGVGELPGNRRIVLRPGEVTIRHRGRQPPQLNAQLRLAGTVADAAALLEQRGLSRHAPSGMDFSRIKANLEASLDLDFLISAEPEQRNVRSKIAARLTGLHFANFLGPAALERGTLDLTVDGRTLSAKGSGRVLGAPATISINRSQDGPLNGRVSLTLDAAARAKIGWGSGETIAGPVGVTIAGPLAGGGGLRGDVALDLTRAALSGLVPGLDKPAGRAARASFKLAANDERISLTNFDYRGQGIVALGTIDLSGAGKFRSARFRQLKLSPGDDLRAEIGQSGEGLRIALSGAAIDLRPFLSRQGGAIGKPGTAAKLTINTRIATGHNSRVLGNFKLDTAVDNDGLSVFRLNALAGRAQVSGRLLQRGRNGPMIELASADGGTVLAFLDVYKRMQGGRMALRAQLAGNAVTGTLEVRNFILRNEPALRQLVARGTQDAARTQIDASSVRFEKLQFGFSRGAGRLAVRDGILSGPEIGLTLDGQIDFAGDRVAMSGTFVPAYGLNNAFARIPLFGPILGGGRNEGLLGVNFRVSGRASAPVLNINPLSAIAPGFLRKIFGALPAGGAPPGAARSSGQLPTRTLPEQRPDMPMRLGAPRQ